MRSIFLLALVLWSCLASARDFKLSLRGSGMYVIGKTGSVNAFPDRNTTGYAGSFQFRHGGERLELVHGLEIGSLQGEDADYSHTYKYRNSYHTTNLTIYQNIAQTYYLPHIMANIKLPVEKGSMYAGAMAGFLLTESYGRKWSGSSVKAIEYYSFTTLGAALGLQGGISYPISKHFELAGELGVRRIWLSETNFSILDTSYKLDYRLVTFNISAGINYVF